MTRLVSFLQLLMDLLDTDKESIEGEMSDMLVMVQRRKSDFNVEVGPRVSRALLLPCTSKSCHSFANNIFRLATDSISSWRSLAVVEASCLCRCVFICPTRRRRVVLWATCWIDSRVKIHWSSPHLLSNHMLLVFGGSSETEDSTSHEVSLRDSCR